MVLNVCKLSVAESGETLLARSNACDLIVIERVTRQRWSRIRVVVVAFAIQTPVQDWPAAGGMQRYTLYPATPTSSVEAAHEMFDPVYAGGAGQGGRHGAAE